jgi:DeoR/GlpR family transcriptional regulator of sugar metabolism
MGESIVDRRDLSEQGSSGAKSSASASPGKQQLRLTAILEKLRHFGSVNVEELSAELGASLITIRRDLDQLERDGLLQRTHGGAVSIEPLFYQPFKNDLSFQAHLEKFAEEKRRIGRAAAAMIQKGETIALTPGTTTLEVIRGLPFNQNITIVSNTVNIAMELSKRKDINVFVTGGHLRGDWFSLVGPTAIQSLQNILIHTLFVGVDGINSKWGTSSFNEEEAGLIAAMVKRSRRKIAVADRSKLGVVAGWRICETSDLDMLITDAQASDESIAEFENSGVAVMRV